MLDPGAILADYVIEGVIGRGGMGVVYRARQAGGERVVALKVMAPEVAGDAVYRARFQRESRVAASINHLNVVAVHEVGEYEGQLYIAMEFIDGPSLDAVLAQGPLPPQRAVHIIEQVAAGLEAAHVLGLVHRDVKPGNVLLNADDVAFVTDFGLATAGGDEMTRDGDFAGTLDYVPPERIHGNRGDPRADVYSLGCLLFTALTGRVPYPRDSQAATLFAHISDPIPRPSEVAPALTAFDAVVARAMAKQPDDRYRSAADFAAALPAITRMVELAAPSPAAPAAPVAAPPPPPALTEWPTYVPPPRPADTQTAPAAGHDPQPTAPPPEMPASAPPGRRRRWPRLRRWRAAPLPPPATNGRRPAREPSTAKLARARRRATAARVPMNEGFRYVHHPFASQEEGLPLLGNEEVVLALVERILHSNGGAFLLTGFRGVGKTTVVLSALDHLRDELGPEGVVPVFLNVARPKTTEELLFEVIRRLFEALVDGRVLERLPLDIQRQLVLAYTRTSLSFTQTHGSAVEHARGLSLGVPLLEAISPKVELSRKTTDSLAMEASFLAYSAADVEHDFLRIVSLFRRRDEAPDGRWNGKVVIVIDELDKLTMTESGRAALDELVSGLKNLLTTWGVHFVFIAGPDLHDLSLRHSHRGNSVYDSVFGWQLYVPSVWQATARLLEAVLPPGWQHQVEFASLADYLRFKARGVPRLLLMELNSLVEWEDGRPYVTLRAADRKRIEFYAGIERVLAGFTKRAQDGHPFMVPIDEDRWRIGAYYVTDWILRTLGRTFTVEDVIRTDDDVALDPLLVLVPEKVEELLEHLRTHEIVVRVRGVGAADRHFGDVPTAQVVVYKLADDVVTKLREFARDNVKERADLLASSLGEDAPVAAQPWGRTRTGDIVGKGRYELDEEIDRGGMGRVYRARDRQRGREVAIKMLDVPDLTRDEVMHARFERKANLALGLQHANIVATLDTFTEDDARVGIVMEFVTGTSLQQLLKQVRVPPSDAVSLANGLLSALEYLDERGIVRLDLKPSSIMITGDFTPIIVDLGLAKHGQSGSKITRTGEFLGTPAYLAPEIVRGEAVDIRADIYTIGLLLFELLARHPARAPGELYEVLRAATTDDVDVDSLDMASPELRDAIRLMLAREPATRFRSPDLARAALSATPEGGATHA